MTVTALREIGWTQSGAEFLVNRADECVLRLTSKFTGVAYCRRTLRGHDITPAMRKAVYERDAYRCQHCGDWHNLTVDHVIPVRRGGLTVFHNLQTLCQPCNSTKRDK